MGVEPSLDTSALAKWYLNERYSEQFEVFIQEQPSALISRLTAVEFRCLLARRRRTGEISIATEARVYAAFEHDIGAGFLHLHPVDDHHVLSALGLIIRLRRHPLRTLDALHLAIAQALDCSCLATADKIMAAAGKAAGLDSVTFFGPVVSPRLHRNI